MDTSHTYSQYLLKSTENMEFHEIEEFIIDQLAIIGDPNSLNDAKKWDRLFTLAEFTLTNISFPHLRLMTLGILIGVLNNYKIFTNHNKTISKKEIDKQEKQIIKYLKAYSTTLIQLTTDTISIKDIKKHMTLISESLNILNLSNRFLYKTRMLFYAAIHNKRETKRNYTLWQKTSPDIMDGSDIDETLDSIKYYYCIENYEEVLNLAKPLVRSHVTNAYIPTLNSLLNLNRFGEANNLLRDAVKYVPNQYEEDKVEFYYNISELMLIAYRLNNNATAIKLTDLYFENLVDYSTTLNIFKAGLFVNTEAMALLLNWECATLFDDFHNTNYYTDFFLKITKKNKEDIEAAHDSKEMAIFNKLVDENPIPQRRHIRIIK